MIERLIRTIKNECTRKLLVPYDDKKFRNELASFVEWYKGHRPHSGLEVRTPDEVWWSIDSLVRRIQP